MTPEERGSQIDQFVYGAKWVLVLLAILAIGSVAITLAGITESRRQTIQAIVELEKQVDVLKDQNLRSIDDRARIWQQTEDMRQSIGRTEASSAWIEKAVRDFQEAERKRREAREAKK